MSAPPGERGGPTAETASHQNAAHDSRKHSDSLPSRLTESPLTAAETAVVERIREACRSGRPAPTTDEIAELLGCESLSTPVAALRRLQLRGFFRFESYQHGRRFWIADGRSTAPVRCTQLPWRWRSRAGDDPAKSA